jgi:hypothetical protein
MGLAPPPWLAMALYSGHVERAEIIQPADDHEAKAGALKLVDGRGAMGIVTLRGDLTRTVKED